MEGVAQLSRPYQVALAAIAVLGLVWALALRGHAPGHGESTGSLPRTPSPAANATAEEKAAATPTPIYHGAAPGVEGLTRAIAKAHEAVATSQQNAQQLQQHSREASQEAPTTAAGNQRSGSATHGAGSATHNAGSAAHNDTTTAAHRSDSAAAVHAKQVAAAHVGASTHPAARTHRGGRRAGGATHGVSALPAAQVAVEHEVATGKTVLLLFWVSKSSVDREVHSEVAAMVAHSHGRLALHAGTPGQVGEFGSITEVVHVYQTPTILIVNRHGVVSTLTGLTDTFALRQIVHEAERADG